MIESFELFEADGALYAWVTEGDSVNALRLLAAADDGADVDDDGDGAEG